MPEATLNFLPWVRQGIAAAVTNPDSLGAGQPAITTVATELQLNGEPVPGLQVRLRGPADVIGIDPAQVIRCDPPPGSRDFEPNAFASVEFDRADMPWLFTPARADSRSRLRPWMSLVVVRRREGIRVTSSPGQPLPVLQIDDARLAALELPDPRESWAWAHAQVVAQTGSAAAVAAALDGPPELSLSRLICPRLLSPDTEYLACVVPTFEVGRRSGLGLPISEAELAAADALSAAWSRASTATAPVRLPVYYQWEFRTGSLGDFEALARRLRPAVRAGLGQRSVDIGHPGFAIEGIGQVPVHGALLPLDAPAPEPVDTAISRAHQTRLAEIVNAASRQGAAPSDPDPLVAPPLYGSSPAGRVTVTPGSAQWLDQLNLDPRARLIAGLGTRVVQQHQEALMASAWEQAGALMPANQQLRQLQLGMHVAESLELRHLARLGEEAMLRVAAPAFARLQGQPGVSLLAEQAGSRLPLGANGWAMRRIGRQRGPLRRRIREQTVGSTRMAGMTWIERMNGGSGAAAVPAPTRAPVFSAVPPLPTQPLDAGSHFGVFLVASEGVQVAAPGAPCFVAGRTELAGHFRAAVKEFLSRSGPYVAPPPAPALSSLDAVRPRVLAQMKPAVAYAALARARVSIEADGLMAATDMPGVQPLSFTPRFPQPVAEALMALAPDFMLPGLENIPADSVVGLRTNPRFVAACMAGLNHEMARELLWRGFPSDPRATCFGHFWRSGIRGAGPDVDDLDHWGSRPLDDSAGLPYGDTFAMVLRSALLARYPDAVISLVPAVASSGATGQRQPDPDPGRELLPSFSGSLPPDLAYFGFDVPAEVVAGLDGGPGYYVVIQEHPTAPRFGLDAGIDLGADSHLALAGDPPPGVPLNGRQWAANAAEMAAITRRLPVRIAIHASRLLAGTSTNP